MNINDAKNMLTLKDDGCEVAVLFGRLCIGRLLEDSNRWYLADSHYKDIGNLMGYDDKELAYAALLAWFSEA